MTTTISFKVSTKLAEKLKKSSKIRGISMSDLIRNALEDLYDKSRNKKEKEPKIFSYFGIFEKDDEQWQSVKNSVQARKKNYKIRKVEI